MKRISKLSAASEMFFTSFRSIGEPHRMKTGHRGHSWTTRGHECFKFYLKVQFDLQSGVNRKTKVCSLHGWIDLSLTCLFSDSDPDPVTSSAVTTHGCWFCSPESPERPSGHWDGAGSFCSRLPQTCRLLPALRCTWGGNQVRERDLSK